MKIGAIKHEGDLTDFSALCKYFTDFSVFSLAIRFFPYMLESINSPNGCRQMANNTIMDSGNLAEERGDFETEIADLTATNEPSDAGMNFHVQMHGYTTADFEDMIVRVAADKLLSRSNEKALSKEVEVRTLELLSSKMDAVLEPITADILDQPLMPEGFGSANKTPMTMREFIGLCGREFLETKVDRDGNPTTSTRFGGFSETRVERLVRVLIDKKFKDEINAQTLEVVKELKAAAQRKLDEVIQEERERLTKALGYEIERKR